MACFCRNGASRGTLPTSRRSGERRGGEKGRTWGGAGSLKKKKKNWGGGDVVHSRLSGHSGGGHWRIGIARGGRAGGVVWARLKVVWRRLADALVRAGRGSST